MPIRYLIKQLILPPGILFLLLLPPGGCAGRGRACLPCALRWAWVDCG